MSSLVFDEMVALLKESPSSSSSTNDDGVSFEEMVVSSGIVDYLSSVVASEAEEGVSLSVDIDGLKEVVDSFLPPIASISRDKFSTWFDSLLAKQLSEKKIAPPIKSPVEEKLSFAPKIAPIQRQRTSSLQENETQPKEELIKKQMIEKFSYVTEDEYRKEHRPHVAVDEEKKLTRFRNNKVVSTKGDRTTESEEMKGTYVHIKQYRRFKFH